MVVITNWPILFHKFYAESQTTMAFPMVWSTRPSKILTGSPGQPPKAATTAGETRVVPGQYDKSVVFCGWSMSCRICESLGRCLTALKDARQQVELCEEWCFLWENYKFFDFFVSLNESFMNHIWIIVNPCTDPGSCWSTPINSVQAVKAPWHSLTNFDSRGLCGM